VITLDQSELLLNAFVLIYQVRTTCSLFHRHDADTSFIGLKIGWSECRGYCG
jgi:hypothetical protein